MNKYRLAVKCASEHIVVFNDQMDKHTFVSLACLKCDSEPLCQDIRRTLEKHLNYKLAVK